MYRSLKSALVRGTNLASENIPGAKPPRYDWNGIGVVILQTRLEYN